MRKQLIFETLSENKIKKASYGGKVIFDEPEGISIEEAFKFSEEFLIKEKTAGE